MAQQDQIIIDVSQVQNQDEMQHLLKLFPKKLLLTFSFLQLFFGFFVSKLDNYYNKCPQNYIIFSGYWNHICVLQGLACVEYMDRTHRTYILCFWGRWFNWRYQTFKGNVRQFLKLSTNDAILRKISIIQDHCKYGHEHYIFSPFFDSGYRFSHFLWNI